MKIYKEIEYDITETKTHNVIGNIRNSFLSVFFMELILSFLSIINAEFIYLMALALLVLPLLLLIDILVFLFKI